MSTRYYYYTYYYLDIYRRSSVRAFVLSQEYLVCAVLPLQG